MKLNKYWFKPKRYGYGAYPCSWEGWTIVLLAVGTLILLSEIILADNPPAFIVSVLVLVAIICYVSWKKTKGQWAWRWGSEE